MGYYKDNPFDSEPVIKLNIPKSYMKSYHSFMSNLVCIAMLKRKSLVDIDNDFRSLSKDNKLNRHFQGTFQLSWLFLNYLAENLECKVENLVNPNRATLKKMIEQILFDYIDYSSYDCENDDGSESIDYTLPDFSKDESFHFPLFSISLTFEKQINGSTEQYSLLYNQCSLLGPKMPSDVYIDWFISIELDCGGKNSFLSQIWDDVLYQQSICYLKKSTQ